MNRTAAMIALPVVAIGLGVFGGCSGDQPKGDETPDTVARGTPTPAPEVTEVQTYTFHGTVTKIDESTQMITIDHEKIGDYMDAMTMPFKVADPAILAQVKVGDETHFTLRVAGDQALITEVQQEHDNGEGH